MDFTGIISTFKPGINVSNIKGMDGLLFSGNHSFSQADFPENKAAKYLYLYISPWLLLFGTLGNVLSYAIMQKMSFRVWSTCLYMAAIPLVDLVILYMECGNNWVLYLCEGQLNISHILMVSSNAICKVYTFLLSFVHHISPWLVVAMLGECVLSVRFTRQMPRLCTREHTRAVILLITVLLICVNIHFFWTRGLTQPMAMDSPYNVRLCTYVREWAESFRDVIWPSINTTIEHLLPLLVSVILCLILALTYVRMVTNKNFRRLQDARNEALYQHLLDPIAFQEFQGTILAVGFAYLVLVPPQLCLTVYRYILFNYQHVEYTLKLDAQLKLLGTITNVLNYIFLSTKFIIYYISSKRFQRELSEIFQMIFKPFTNCTKHKYAVRNSPSLKGKSWQDDDQRVRLVVDGKNHVTHALDNSAGLGSHYRSQQVTTDV